MKLNLSLLAVLLVILPLRFIGQMTPLYRDSDSSARVLSMHFLGETAAFVVFDKWVGYSSDSGRQFQRWSITASNVQLGAYDADFNQSFKANGVTAINESNVFLYGHLNGTPAILQTIDKGKNFKLVHYNRDMDSPSDAGVQNMIFLQNGNRGIAVEYDRILLSSDKGLTWNTVYVNYNEFLEKIDFIDDNTVNVYSAQKILRTTDGGLTWNEFPIPGAAMSSLDFITPVKGWVVNGPYLYRTVDGQNWQLMNPASDVFDAFAPIHFFNDSVGIMCGPNFSTLKTTTGGMFWEPLSRQDSFTSGNRRHRLLFYDKYGGAIFTGGDHGNIERLRNKGGTPLPVARFRLDTTFYATTKQIYFTNFSNPVHSFIWLHQGKVISEEFDAPNIASDRLVPDTFQLVAINGQFRDTMTIVLPALQGIPPCSAAFNISVSTDTAHINAQDTLQEMKHYWDLGDGNTRKDIAYFSHAYKKVGTYTVVHVLYNPATNCIDTVRTKIEVVRLDKCTNGEIKIQEEGLKINERKFSILVDSLIEKKPLVSTAWTFGDGNTSTDSMPIHKFITPGTYQVCVEITNLATTCKTSKCTTVTIDVNPDSCSAKFNSYTKNSDSSITVGDRLILFKSEVQPNGKLIQHTWKANGRDTIFTGTEGVWEVNFFQEGRQPEFRGKAGDQCATDQIASIHVDSLTRIISHFVYDPATGCRDSFSLVVQVPVRKKISFISLEDQLIPGGVRMHALDNRDSIGWPYYSVWAIESASDSYFTGQYTEGHQTINHIFSKTGTYRVSVAEHTCTDNVREVYYTNYSVKAIGCPTYEPFIVYDTPLASDPFLIDFRADGSDLFSAYPTNTVRWYFGDGDSSLQVSPQHRYKSGGTYLVQVVYETVAGCKLSKSIELQLPGGCNNEAAFNYVQDSTNPARYLFFSDHTGNDSLLHKWYFGNGDSSSVENPVHVYNTAGQYRVQYRISNPDGTCSSVHEKILDVTFPQACELKASFTYLIDGNSVLFSIDTASTIFGNRIHWSFGDGDTSNHVHPLHRYDTSGTYRVCLTLQKDAGCFVQFCDSVKISYAGLSMIQGFPNPVQGQLFVRYFSEKQEGVVLELLNESGLIMQSSRIQALPGANSFVLDLSKYKNGIYIVRTISASGVRQAYRIVKL